jgi:hypothetical protein
MKRMTGVAVPIVGNLIQTPLGKQEKSRMGAAIRRGRVVIQAALLQPEVAALNNVPKRAAKVTRIRGTQIMNRSLADLIQPGAAALNNMLKPAGKVVKTAMAGAQGAVREAKTNQVLLVAARPSSMLRRAAKAIKIPDKKRIK